MKKRIISAIMAACMMLSTIVAADYTASAVTTEAAETSTSSTYKLAESTDDGVILQAWNWSYANVEANLEKLASLGYTTIQVSPPSVIKAGTSGLKVYYGKEGTTGWWMFYQPAGFTLNELEDNALGTKDELVSLTTKAHSLGMKIIADGVINHLGTNQGEEGQYVAESDDNSTANDQNTILRVTEKAWTYAKDIVDANAFHPYFDTIYLENTGSLSYYLGKMKLPGYDMNQTAEYHSTFDMTQGSISNLPDLDTGSEVVQQAILNYFKECIDAGIDGFRIDAAKHIETPDDPEGVNSDFWPTVVYGANAYAKEKYDREMFYYGEILNSCGIDRPYSRYLKYMEITDSTTYYGQFNAASGNAGAYGSTYSNGMDADTAITWAESHDIYMDYFNHDQTVVSEEVVNKRWALAAARDNTAMYFARPYDVYTTTLGDADETAWASTEVAAINHFHNEMKGESESISTSGGKFAYNERGTTGVVIVNCQGTSTSVKDLPMKKLAAGTYTDHITGNRFVCKDGKLSGEMGETGIVVLFKENLPKVSIGQESGTYYTDTTTVGVVAKNVDKATYKINGADEVEFTDNADITVGKASDVAGTTYQVSVYGYVKDKLVAVQTATFTKQNPKIVKFNLNGTAWNSVNIYAWNDATGATNSSWPGVPMTKNNDGTYSIELIGDYANIIFNDGSSQTKDLTYEGSGTYTLNGDTCSYVSDGAVNADPFYADGYEPTNPPATYHPSGYATGDVTKDGNVNISDVTLIQKSLIQLATLDDDQSALADFNKSDTVNIKDATAIQYMLVGLE